MTTSQVTTRPAATETGPAERTEPGPPAPKPEPYRRPRLGRRLRGPRRLSVRAAVAIILLAALCATAVIGSVTVRADTSRLHATVSERAAVAAKLRYSLADLDAQRADTLAPGMSAAETGVYVGDQLNALITAQQRRTEVSGLLQQLSGDRAHSGLVVGILNGLARYDDLSGRADYVDGQSPDRLAGHPSKVTVSMNVQAGEIMNDALLPAASALSAAYQRQADADAASVHDIAARWLLAVGVLGLVTLFFLLWWQRELARDYRRLVSLPLSAATAAVLAVGLAGVVALSSCSSAVASANRDGLRPWSRLAEAKAVAAQAAAAESRWFVHGTALGTADQAQFTSRIKQLDKLLTPTGYATAAERPAYQDVLTRYGHFRADDARLRKLKASGDTDAAAAVLTEVARGDVAFDFWDFATTLDALAEQQLDAFTAHADDARGALGGWPGVPAGALGVAGALVLLAVRPRLAEYR